MLVFTAGVGENSREVRTATCSRLEFLGLKLAENLNEQTSLDRDIATADSRVRVLGDSSGGGLGHCSRMLEACAHHYTNGRGRLMSGKRYSAQPGPLPAWRKMLLANRAF